MKLARSRPRRNRKNSSIRQLLKEHHVRLDDLIVPLFVSDPQSTLEPIPSMPGQYKYPLHHLLDEIEQLIELGLFTFALFPVIKTKFKNPRATFALNPDNFYLEAISKIKSKFPQVILMSDVALDPYSSDGHDGLLDPSTGEILNDQTLFLLAEMSVLQAQAGADLIGPSDMMDGRVGFIRDVLDEKKFINTSIISYTAKYASSFYTPFRDALDSTPPLGDKKTYQMDIGNSREALREMSLDELEGADILMVKPGLSYLDIVSKISQKTSLPVAVYNVSGEYSMVKAAAEKGWIDEHAAIVEILTSFKRAGADLIISYFSKEYAHLLKMSLSK